MELISTLVPLSQALVAPLIAGFGSYISYQQLRANKLKLILERYDRRLSIYEEVVKILAIMSRDSYATVEDLLNFRKVTSEADFLFGADISNYIKDIYSRGMKVTLAHREYRDYTQSPPPGYDHKKVVERMHAEDDWLDSQFDVAKEKFRQYLDISG